MRLTSELGETAQSLTGIGLARRIMTPVPAMNGGMPGDYFAANSQ